VFVNGNEITHNVLWVDIRRGVVCYAPSPIRAKRPVRDEVYTRELRGVVTVEAVGDAR